MPPGLVAVDGSLGSATGGGLDEYVVPDGNPSWRRDDCLGASSMAEAMGDRSLRVSPHSMQVHDVVHSNHASAYVHAKWHIYSPKGHVDRARCGHAAGYPAHQPRFAPTLWPWVWLRRHR